MLPVIATALGSLFDGIVNKFFPNKTEIEKQQIAAEMQALALQSDLLKGQQVINAEEAKSDSIYKSGWRPAVGWLCTFGLAYQTVGIALIKTLFALLVLVGVDPSSIKEATLILPTMDTATLVNLLFNMLGIGYIGTLRTVEKLNSKA